MNLFVMILDAVIPVITQLHVLLNVNLDVQKLAKGIVEIGLVV